MIWLREWLMAERFRWTLWAPVCFGAGIANYFMLPNEPDNATLYCLPGLAILLFWVLRRSYTLPALLLGGVFLATLGFSHAKLYTQQHHVTMVHEEVRPTMLEGRVTVIDVMPGAHRLTLEDVVLLERPDLKVPERVRIKVRGAMPPLLTGDRIRIRAGLMPVSGPAMPGGFDFARFFYFRGIGAVGYGLPPLEVISSEAPSWQEELGLWWLDFRKSLVARIRAHMPEREGSVAAALMLGDRTGIPENVLETMRETNLSHLLAISGMHLAMVAGMVFFSIRFLLVAIPRTQHGRHNKQWAAGAALLAGALYVCVAGFPISAMRAYVMVALVLLAVLINRQVMPMRSLALAAMLLLLYNPSYILEPGFQLSFAATIALIAFFETTHRFWRDGAWRQEGWRARWKEKIIAYFLVVSATTLVAELATGPLVIHHFNNFSLYGIIANMVVMPLVTLLIMPAMLLAFLLMPLGLESAPLWCMGLGIGWMLDIADWVAALPNATQYVQSLTPWGLLCALAGGLWLCLWQQRVRWLGLAVFCIGLTSLAFNHLPDVLISPDAKRVAIKTEQGLRLLQGRTNFITDQWASGYGQSDMQKADEETLTMLSHRCDAVGCAWRHDASVLATPKRNAALEDDCTLADVIILPFTMRQTCEAEVIDRRRLQQYGTHWLWLNDGKIRLENSAMLQGNRPWSVGVAR